MATENTASTQVRITDVKRLDPSLKLPLNAQKIERVVFQLEKIISNEQLLSGSVIDIPLEDGRTRSLTVYHSTREGIPKEEQKQMFFWTDYAALLLDLVTLLRPTPVANEFFLYEDTEKQLIKWAHASEEPEGTLSELEAWENRREIITLVKKIVIVFKLKSYLTEDQKEFPLHITLADIKKIRADITISANFQQVKDIFNTISTVTSSTNTLLDGKSIKLPLDISSGTHSLTTTTQTATRAYTPRKEQEKKLYWSDYTYILLQLAYQFKYTDKSSDFSEYQDPSTQLFIWGHASRTPENDISEATIVEHESEIATLIEKLKNAFSEKNTSDKPDSAKRESDLNTGIVSSAPEAATSASSAQTTNNSELPSDLQPNPQLKQGEEIDLNRPLREQLSNDQMRQYTSSVGWMTSFTMLQIADAMGIELSDLDPTIRSEITTYAIEYLQKEGDIADLLKGSPTARLKAIRGLNRFLREQNFYEKNKLATFQNIQSTHTIFEDNLHTILSDSNPVLDKNIEKTVESIVIVHKEKSVELLQSLDKQKIEIIFGLATYNLSDSQITALKKTLISYAHVRLSEIILHTQSEDSKKAIVQNQNLDIQDSLELVGSIRDTIATHSSKNEGEGELTADALTTNPDRTSKKIQFALQQNEKIFGSYWKSLSPAEQALALQSLGAGFLVKGDKHPVGGYELPINIAELDISIFKKFNEQIKTANLPEEEITEEKLQIAREINEYRITVERAQTLSLHMKNEYVIYMDAPFLQEMHAQQSLLDRSYQEIVFADQERELSQFQEDSQTEGVPSAPNSLSRLKGSLKSVSKNPVASKLKSAAAQKIAEKLAMGTGVGAALVTANKFLDKTIGAENKKRLLALIGGLSAGAAGALLYRTFQALQTLGGAVGGFLGGITGLALGGPVGGAIGVIGGANAGAAAQSWIGSFFGGGGGASSSGIGSTAAPFSSSSVWGARTGGIGSGGIGSGGSTTFSAASQSASNAIPGMGTSTPTLTNAAQQPLLSASGSAAATSTSAAGGIQAAVAATGSFITSLPAIVIGAGIILPGFTTLIVFIVIMGAFLVPMPFTIDRENQSISQYATVIKTTNPEEIENETQEDISYTISILPKPGYSLEIKRVTDEFLVLGGDATVPDSPLTAAAFPSEQFKTKQVAEYTLPISGKDALVINTVTFVVDVYDSSNKLLIQGESISALGLLIIGDPPIGCFTFAPAGNPTYYETESGEIVTNMSQEWTQQDVVKLLKAFINRVGTNPQFLQLLCAEGDITLHKWDSHPNGYWGWKVTNSKIGLYGDFFNGGSQAQEYTIIHESAHIIDGRNPDLRPDFKKIKTPPLSGDSGCFTYPFPANCNEGEAFAEAIADYVVWQTFNFSTDGWIGMFPFKTRYPAEYQWVQTNIFGGIEY